MGPENLDVIKFQKRCNPIDDTSFMGTGFGENCWGLDGPITQNDISVAAKAHNLLPPESSGTKGGFLSSRLEHIARIAWFVVHGWNDPIHIDVGVPSLGCYPAWPLEDGNHRFAAAIVRGDRVIPTDMSGAVSEIQKFLWKEPSYPIGAR